ncbi:MAG TPA: hypothetical protein VGN65_09500 [Casimicrobiaceae bacterium]
MKKLWVAAVGVGLLAMQAGAGAWGMEVHRLITKHAIDGLPAEVKPFYAARADFIVEHSVDPDLWRTIELSSQFGNEDPNHFLDFDGYGEPAPFSGVPRGDWKDVVQKYGLELANKNGRLPWRAEEVFNKLVAAFKDLQRSPYGADNIRYISAVLAHYTEDANQPFHAIENYDGQATNQRGIHSRFETELIMRNRDTFKPGPVVIKPIADIKTFFFDALLADQAAIAPVLAADKKAAEGRTSYDDAYFADFAKNGALKIAEDKFNDSASAVASVWIAAWEKAGKPKLPTDGARTPAPIRK